MALTKIVHMRFDMTCEYDVATYQRLAESSRRGERRGRGNQALYLVSLMLGTRTYTGLKNAGLTEIPPFDRGIDERVADLLARLKNPNDQMSEEPGQAKNRAPVLQLVPPSDQMSPKCSAREDGW